MTRDLMDKANPPKKTKAKPKTKTKSKRKPKSTLAVATGVTPHQPVSPPHRNGHAAALLQQC
jgi:hypothetical protein